MYVFVGSRTTGPLTIGPLTTGPLTTGPRTTGPLKLVPWTIGPLDSIFFKKKVSIRSHTQRTLLIQVFKYF